MKNYIRLFSHHIIEIKHIMPLGKLYFGYIAKCQQDECFKSCSLEYLRSKDRVDLSNLDQIKEK